MANAVVWIWIALWLLATVAAIVRYYWRRRGLTKRVPVTGPLPPGSAMREKALLLCIVTYISLARIGASQLRDLVAQPSQLNAILALLLIPVALVSLRSFGSL